MGGFSSELARYLGSVATRVNRRLSSHNGFAIGQRVLPAFSGMRLLFSTKLMFVATVFLAIGCLLRVSSEILAYQGLVRSAWSWLPVSAITEMTAVTLFAVNLLATFARRPPSTFRGLGTITVRQIQPHH